MDVSDEDEGVSEIIAAAFDRVDGVGSPATGLPFLLLKAAAPQGKAAKRKVKKGGGSTVQQARGSVEIPATNCPGEADSILASVTGQRTTGLCAARTQDGRPCMRPAVNGGACHHHDAMKSVITAPGPATAKAPSTRGETHMSDDAVKAVKPKKVARLAAKVHKAAHQLPGQDPRRQAALATAMFLALKVRNGGTVTKAEFAGLESQGEAIAAATADAVARVTSPGVSPKSTDIRALFQQQPASLAGTQNDEALAAYSSPAASLGQTLKAAEDEVGRARERLRVAKAHGSAHEVEAAGYELTLAELKRAHLTKAI